MVVNKSDNMLNENKTVVKQNIRNCCNKFVTQHLYDKENW